jgi:hypothetical protein
MMVNQKQMGVVFDKDTNTIGLRLKLTSRGFLDSLTRGEASSST